MFRRFGIILFGAVLMLGVFVLGDVSVVNAKSACSCSCVDSAEPHYFTNLSSGNIDCRADCAQVCGGSLELVEGEQLLISVDCLPGQVSDCRGGAFSVYEGVNCVLQNSGTDPATWEGTYLERTEGRVPRCVIPLTPRNANIECQRFGDIASGGTCGFIVEGENPNAYYKSRPSLGGQTGTQAFTANYATTDAWETAVTAGRGTYPNFTVNATDGICYRYGVKYGGAPTYEGFDPTAPGVEPFAVVPSAEYVCLQRKRNTCGTVDPPSGHNPTLPARSYSCQVESEVKVQGGGTLNSICFGVTGQDAELCISSPGTRCCQGGTVFGGCFTDSDCSDDRSKVCREGQCVENLVCDPRSGNEDRRCRSASEAERASDNVCSFELGQGRVLAGDSTESFSLLGPRCPRPGQSCCIPRDPAVTSGCASDKVVEFGNASAYAQFGCVDVGDLPDSQFVLSNGSRGPQLFIGNRAQGETGATTETSTDREARYHAQGGSVSGNPSHCLGSDIPVVRDGRVVGSVRRCDAGQVCCNRRALDVDDTLDAQAPLGATGCSLAQPNYQCLSANVVAAENQDLGRGTEDFLRGLVTRGACQVTPIEGSYLFANRECQSPGICCDPSVNTVVLCAVDADCGNGAVCDQELGRCLSEEFSAAALAGDGCYDEAWDAGYVDQATAASERTGVLASQFSCQFVKAGETPNIGTNCINPPEAACGSVATPDGLTGHRAQCCVPNTGLSAGVALQIEARRVVEPSPFSIELSPCIQDGNCGLEDILYTGAGFANFLIQISGAVFLAIFVYGGFLYLTAGKTERAMKGKKMIIQASVAMVLILAAFVFVNFVQQSLIGAVVENDAQASCGNDAATANFACQFLASDPNNAQAASDEISRRGCVRNRCPGPENYLCCPL